MANKKKSGTPKPRKFIEELLVELYDHELNAKREQLQDIAFQLQDLEQKRTETIKKLNDEKTKLTIQHDQLLEVLRAKGEKKPVDCIEEFDLDTNSAVTRRTDTDEVLRKRALNGEERAQLAQGELPAMENGVEPEVRA